MRILVTGFEPFGAVNVNPSEQIVRKLTEVARAEKRDDLVTEILPTEFTAAGKKIRRLIRAIRPEAVVCLGVAPSREIICLERVALNLDDEESPDNAGRIRIGRRIQRDAPVAYWTTLPLKEIRRAMEKAGIPSKISNHAGTYVCNHVFYCARHEVERMKSSAPCGLIHVPAIRRRGKGARARGLPLSKMIVAMECCLNVLREKERP